MTRANFVSGMLVEQLQLEHLFLLRKSTNQTIAGTTIQKWNFKELLSEIFDTDS